MNHLKAWHIAILAFLIPAIWATNYSILRSTGDEKVYIAQALEMVEAGNWFLQLFKGDAYYFKGPVFIILIRLGFLLFGEGTIFSLLYMNVIGYTFAIYFFYRCLIQNKFLENREAAAFSFLTFSTVGCFSHLYASQMEALTVVLYAGILYLVTKANPHENAEDSKVQKNFLLPYFLWALVGCGTWLKSPVYSVLLGISVLGSYLFVYKIPFRKMIADKTLPILFGVFISILPFLPILYLDFNTFWETHIVRENLNKGGNGIGYWQAIVPIFTWFLYPIILQALYFLGTVVHSHLIKKCKSDLPTQVKLAVFLLIPTLIFFSIHPYRSAIYSLPLIPGFMILVAYGYNLTKDLNLPMKQRLLTLVQTPLILVLPGLLLFLKYAPSVNVTWLPSEIVWLSLVSAIIATVLQLNWNPVRLAASAFVINLGMILPTLNQLGFEDIQYLKKEVRGINKDQKIYYWATAHTMFTEWGLLRSFTNAPLSPIFSEHQLSLNRDEHRYFLFNKKKELESEFLRTFGDQIGSYSLVSIPRWKVHIHTQGDLLAKDSPLAEYLKTGELAPFKKNMYLLKVL